MINRLVHYCTLHMWRFPSMASVQCPLKGDMYTVHTSWWYKSGSEILIGPCGSIHMTHNYTWCQSCQSCHSVLLSPQPWMSPQTITLDPWSVWMSPQVYKHVPPKRHTHSIGGPALLIDCDLIQVTQIWRQDNNLNTEPVLQVMKSSGHDGLGWQISHNRYNRDTDHCW